MAYDSANDTIFYAAVNANASLNEMFIMSDDDANITAIVLDESESSVGYALEDTVVTDTESISVPRFTSFTPGNQFWS